LLENLLFLVFKMKIFLCPEAQEVGAEAENLVIHSPLLVSGRALQRLRANTRDLHHSSKRWKFVRGRNRFLIGLDVFLIDIEKPGKSCPHGGKNLIMSNDN